MKANAIRKVAEEGVHRRCGLFEILLPNTKNVRDYIPRIREAIETRFSFRKSFST